MRQRRRWFTPPTGPTLALWWTPAGRHPDGVEAHRRLDMLRRHGPTPDSFTLEQTYPAGTATAWRPSSHLPDPSPPPPENGRSDKAPPGPALPRLRLSDAAGQSPAPSRTVC
jgi:Domain of unknown function (DUF3291)